MIEFSKILSFQKEKQEKNSEKITDNNNTSWIKCSGCKSLMYFKEVENKNFVCPKCNHHMRMPVLKRIELLCDKDSFVELDNNLKANDPLEFVDKISYKKRLEVNNAKNKRNSSVISGECMMNGINTQLVVFDFSFMGGSLGSVEGEKITRAVNRAIEKQEGVVIVSTSGGARMQESSFSLLQMAKTSTALKKLDKNNLPYISVLTDPTMGGVSASFAMLGDVIIAEPGALIGFAGQRVIQQTINATLPEGFQRAEFLLKCGSIDKIVDRTDMKKTISDMLKIFLNKDTKNHNG
ncbi:Acetyl-coenzyme A carboxyl transferase beta chain [hydrothermal vent metagenome]|uniref:Acetyl-coenzyme A carboxyl transferase beta chain n=1 Tax=hydrothermal vent metagenome TaxID=652676 RepID=A0A3B1E5C0_9ZZZZ